MRWSFGVCVQCLFLLSGCSTLSLCYLCCALTSMFLSCLYPVNCHIVSNRFLFPLFLPHRILLLCFLFLFFLKLAMFYISNSVSSHRRTPHRYMFHCLTNMNYWRQISFQMFTEICAPLSRCCSRKVSAAGLERKSFKIRKKGRWQKWVTTPNFCEVMCVLAASYPKVAFGENQTYGVYRCFTVFFKGSML